MKTFHVTIAVTMPSDSTESECEEWASSVIDLLHENHYGGKTSKKHPYHPTVVGATEVSLPET